MELVHGSVEKTPKASQNIARGNRPALCPLCRGEKDWKKVQSALHSTEGCVHTCRTSRGSSPNPVKRNWALIRAGEQPSGTVLCFCGMIARWFRDVCLFTWVAAPGSVITGFQPFFLMELCQICQASKLFSSLLPTQPFRARSEEPPFISDLLSGSWLIKKVYKTNSPGLIRIAWWFNYPHESIYPKIYHRLIS